MKLYEVQNRTPELMESLLKVWENSVRATHTFLSKGQIDSIKEYVPQVLNGVERLIVVEDSSNKPIAFMGTENGRLEMLFISSNDRGKGIGKLLVHHGIKNYSIKKVTVNEQNPQAVGFYEHLGFKTYKKTPFDEEGNPYPLLYMKL